jgi:uncharacterized surface protein with fasciclin (FAS1) repeats
MFRTPNLAKVIRNAGLGLLALTAAWPVAAKDVIETATDAGTFSVLLAALKSAGLTQTLSGPGPFTIFAPTDDAFAKIPRPQLESLLRVENREKLTQILRYHIVAGRVHARQFLGKRMEAATIEGGSLLIDATKGILVDNAKMVKPDVEADNGVIHIIDTVVMPR